MKEIKAIVEAYHKIDANKNKAALATVVRVEGSSYRRTGARMLVLDTGEWVGGISGGCLEGDALKKAKFAIAQNKSNIITYDTTEDDPFQIGVGLGCNGIIDVLLTPIDPQNIENQILNLEKCIVSREPNIMITILDLKGNNAQINIGQSFLRNENDDFIHLFSIKNDALILNKDLQICKDSKQSTIKKYQTVDGEIALFLEVIIPTTHLIIYGGNYDIYSLVKLAKEIGWMVSVVCNPLKVHKSLFEMADNVIKKEQADEIEIDEFTIAVLMAHDYETDFQNMLKLLKTNVLFIGMLGPKKRTDKMFLQLLEEGNPVSEQELLRIASPVGLDIGATTPEEIAISIIAEIKTFFSGRDGKRLKFRKNGIYDETIA
jgi:xanthine dehydrogenase accessory factor